MRCCLCSETENVILVRLPSTANHRSVEVPLCPAHRRRLMGENPVSKSEEGNKMRCCGRLVNEHGRCTVCGDQY